MKIIIVSPAYAPYAGVGAMRMMSLSKYLLDKGHNVVVFRNSPHLWPADTLKSIPPNGMNIIDVEASGNFEQCVERYYGKLNEYYEKNEVDIALYSCNPYYTIVAAEKIKKGRGAEFVIDFRDLWIKDEALTRSIPRIIKKFLSRLPYRKYERLCVREASAVITVSPRDCECLKKQYPKDSGKIQVVYNGYDEARLSVGLDEDGVRVIDNIENQISKVYSIGVFGKFGYYDYKYVCELLKAVKSLNAKGYNVKIVHIGELDKNSRIAMKKNEFPFEQYIGTGYMDYTAGMKILAGVDMNCLIVHYKRGLGTKLFDYIYLDKPIVYFAPKDSAIADVLKQADNSFICQDSGDAAAAIENIIVNKIKSLEMKDRKKFSRVTQNESYESILSQIVSVKKGV